MRSLGCRFELPKVVLPGEANHVLLLIVYILHDLKDPKRWELWYIPYDG